MKLIEQIRPEFRTINVCMIKTWDRAFKNLVKRGEYRSRAQAIREMLYPALSRECKFFGIDMELEPIIEHKKLIKEPSLPKRFTVLRNFTVSTPQRDLGYRKPKRKKEKKPSVPRRLPKVFIWK